ncbi:MAG: four helix bundle protein [Vicinamibacteria bacterium]|nr:four helix bundle protein [Vicinamibacteria bacterium]
MAQAHTVPNSNHGAVHRLDCYRLAVEFHRLVADLAPHGSGLGDQLRRAAASIALNLAEGHGRLTRAEQARFTLIARGSALECMAVLDLLSGDETSSQSLTEAKRQLLRVVQTTTGLWRRQVR